MSHWWWWLPLTPVHVRKGMRGGRWREKNGVIQSVIQVVNQAVIQSVIEAVIEAVIQSQAFKQRLHPLATLWLYVKSGMRNFNSATIRRGAVREHDISQQHGGSIKGPLNTLKHHSSMVPIVWASRGANEKISHQEEWHKNRQKKSLKATRLSLSLQF